MIFSTLVLGSLAMFSNAVKTFDDHQVLRCNPENRNQLDKLHEWSEDPSLNWDFWSEPRRVGGAVDIMTNPTNRKPVEAALSGIGLKCDVMIQDVQSVIDNETRMRSNKDVSYFESYHTWEDVHAHIEGLAKEFPDYASVSTVGETYEGKPIKVINLSSNPGTSKPTIWLDGGLHAREWIAVPTVEYIADTLLRDYGSATGSNSTFLLDTFDFVICPIINVDGYDFTWNGDRMWRKTRSPNTNPACVGTDPNRNWNFHWGEAGTSPMACSDSYQGPSAASESEVQAVQSYICDHKDTMVGYINFHAYSQLWMSPWGYTSDLPPDYADQNALSAAASEAIYNTHGMTYDYGTISNIIYPASGSSADYCYGVCGVKYSYGVELRDTGEFGFLLPPEEIIPSGEEIFAAIVAMGEYISTH